MNIPNWLSSNRIASRASDLFSPKRRDSLTSRALGTLGLAQKEQTISRSAAAGLICSALATGAALTYLFDPTTGRRRRHLAGQRLYSSARRIGDATDVTARDLANRSRGLFATLRALFSNDVAPHYIIEDRVRSRLGRVASHPRAIIVESNMGEVTLSGPILQDEIDDVLRAAWKTRGVCSIQNRLEPHALPDIPALQGRGRRPGNRIDIAQERWSPTTRMIAGITGFGCMTYCLSKRKLPAALIGTAGFALFVRATGNRSTRRLLGIGAAADSVHVQKIINIAAPPEIVFDFWANYENFPLFMKHVKEVCDCGDGVSHWTVDGPAETTVEWDAYLTDWEPNRLIAWRSFPGASVANQGRVLFQENPDGGTRVDVHLCYTPPAGAIGHAVAKLFGADAKTEMDDDLLRMKTLIEQGRFPHDAAQHVADVGIT